MRTADKIRALPWTGNAMDDIIKGSVLSGVDTSTYGQAAALVKDEPDPDERWEAEKAFQLCCFAEILTDDDRSTWQEDWLDKK